MIFCTATVAVAVAVAVAVMVEGYDIILRVSYYCCYQKRPTYGTVTGELMNKMDK